MGRILDSNNARRLKASDMENQPTCCRPHQVTAHDSRPILTFEEWICKDLLQACGNISEDLDHNATHHLLGALRAQSETSLTVGITGDPG